MAHSFMLIQNGIHINNCKTKAKKKKKERSTRHFVRFELYNFIFKIRDNMDESFAGNEINSNVKRTIETLITKCCR